jgi:hypothetical protein
MSQKIGNMWKRLKTTLKAWWKKHICAEVPSDWKKF